jgi:hypothetical protein
MSSCVLTLLALPFITLGVEGFAAWLRSLWNGSAVKPAVSAEAAEA